MVFLYITLYIGVSVLAQYCNKVLVNKNASGAVVSGMYFICFFVAACGARAFGPIHFLPTVAFVGAINVLAVWLFAGSVRTNMAQTFLVIPLTNSIAVVLSALYLGEWRLLDPRTLHGILQLLSALLLVSASLLFAIKRQSVTRIEWKWILPLAGFIVITGIVNFLIKEFALGERSVPSYLASWYTGTFLASFLPFMLTPRTQRFTIHKNVVTYIVMALATITAMWSSFRALSLSPASVVFPLSAAFYTGGTVLLGLFIFKERRTMSKLNWFGIVCGALGVALTLAVRL